MNPTDGQYDVQWDFNMCQSSTAGLCVYMHAIMRIRMQYEFVFFTCLRVYVCTHVILRTYVLVISCPGVEQQKYFTLGQSALYFLLQHTWTGYN